MRAILVTLACVIVSALLVTMMAKGPPLGLFKPVQPASIGLVDS